MLQRAVGLGIHRGAGHPPSAATMPSASIAAMPTIGTNTSQPAMTAISTRKMSRKAMSTISTTEVEAKKSRTPSYSLTRLAKAPVLPWRSAIGRFITFSNSFCEYLASSRRPISSTSCDRARRRMKSNPSARNTPIASTHRVGTALFGMTRS